MFVVYLYISVVWNLNCHSQYKISFIKLNNILLNVSLGALWKADRTLVGSG
jgi:hypothetical protein